MMGKGSFANTLPSCRVGENDGCEIARGGIGHSAAANVHGQPRGTGAELMGDKEQKGNKGKV